MRPEPCRIGDDTDAVAALDLAAHDVRHMAKQPAERGAEQMQDAERGGVGHALRVVKRRIRLTPRMVNKGYHAGFTRICFLPASPVNAAETMIVKDRRRVMSVAVRSR
jgi:hypothetical protein